MFRSFCSALHRELGIVAVLITIVIGTAGATDTDTTTHTRAQTVVVANTKDNLRHLATGVIIATTGSGLRVLCAAHTTTFDGTITVTTSNGETLNIVGTPQPIPGHDLAILTTSVPHGAFHSATIGAPTAPGEALHVWGHVHGDLYTLSPATVQDLNPTIADSPHAGEFGIRCDTCAPGDSGAGVFNGRGELVGIVTGAIVDDNNRVLMTVAERVRTETIAATTSTTQRTPSTDRSVQP